MQQRKMASLFHLPSSLAFPNINHSPFSSNSIKASHSHFRISIRNENLPPILSKISEFSSKALNFLLSGSLALALSLTAGAINYSISTSFEVVVWTEHTLPSLDPTLWEYTGRSNVEELEETVCKPKEDNNSAKGSRPTPKHFIDKITTLRNFLCRDDNASEPKDDGLKRRSDDVNDEEEGRKEDDGIKEGSGDDVNDDVEGNKKMMVLKKGLGMMMKKEKKKMMVLIEGPGDDANDDEEEEKEDEEESKDGTTKSKNE
ncbi:hypothetical protein FXO37_27605 [Capsicum annuum]|nr:hypothetical protein FXO37_27605 [Capsicum annuum]